MEYVSAVLSCEARDKSPLDFSEMSDLRKGKLILQMSEWFSSPVSLSLRFHFAWLVTGSLSTARLMCVLFCPSFTIIVLDLNTAK